MKEIGVAADHGGFLLKERLAEELRAEGYDVTDFGAWDEDPLDDYPDFVVPMAEAVADGKIDRGIAICGSGVGACVAANKIPGVRAGLIHEVYSARQGVEDDNMNVICLGGRVIGYELAKDLVDAFLAATFRDEERFRRRLSKIADLE
jgi:ribose 5-phosphate isomerase B